MNDPIYITLKQASEHLQAKGLMGQTPRVLRAAIWRGRLAAVRDGRSWATTLAKLDEYENALWHVPSAEAVIGPVVLSVPRGTTPRRPVKQQPSTVSRVHQASALLAPAPRKKGERRPRRPKRPKVEPKPVPQPMSQAMAKARLEYEALPPEERKKRFRDYLDGNRPDWH